MKTELKEFTALAPMGGDYKGQIALHSCRFKTIESARNWVNQRFANPALVAIVEDNEYPALLKLSQDELIKIYTNILDNEKN